MTKIISRNNDYYILSHIFIPGLESFKKENPDKKVVIVLYTGGLDSTYSLMKELDEGNLVIPIYNRLNSESAEDETHELEYMLIHNIEILRRKFYYLEPMKLNVSSHVHFNTSFVFYQQVYNAVSAFTIGYDILQYVDEVIMSLVEGDDSVPYTNELKNIFNSSMKMMLLEKSLQTTLEFPLLKMTKTEVYNNLKDLMKKNDVDLNIFSCEFPKIEYDYNSKDPILKLKPCGKCNSCKRNEKENFKFKDIEIQL